MQGLPTARSSELQDYVVTSNQFYSDLLGYFPEQTSLRQIQESKWNEFTQGKGLDSNSSGIYLPRNQTAAIRGSNPLNLFHEYFGHGLFCEQSLPGRRLVDLEKKLLDEEREEFAGKRFTLEDIKKFRIGNKTFQQLERFRRENLAQYEAFAIWTEYLLSGEFGLEEMFERRHGSLEEADREIVDSVINFSQAYGNLATFYAFGLKKIQDKKRLLALSQDIFPSLDKIKLILHFGSGKPFSDIDLFVVSDSVHPLYSNWVDVRTSGIEELDERIRILDPKVTDPIMIGNLIKGDENYLRRLRRKILGQTITEDAIRYNLEMARFHWRKSLDSFLEEHFQNKNLRSSKTYLTNALALRNGCKVLTFNRLVDYSHSLSSDERPIELKGGIE